MQKESAASRIQANIQELFKGKLAPGEAYIKFQLTAKAAVGQADAGSATPAAKITALLSMKQVQESLIVKADRITALPGMSESIIGIMNSRDRVFCVYDLPHLLNLPTSLIALQKYQIVVLEISQPQSGEKLQIGLAVEQIGGITRLAKDSFQPPTDVPASLQPYVKACLKDAQQQFVLDIAAITAAITTK